jgi:prolyl oligopeptidase
VSVKQAFLIIPCILVAACSPRERGVPAPPPTRQARFDTTIHGVRVADPWRWLDSADSPEVRSWIAAQNAYADTVLGSFPEGKWIGARVRQLLATSPARTSPKLVAGTLFYVRETPPEPQAVLVAQAWPSGSARVLVDPNGLSAGTAITGYWPSPRGRYVVYGTNVDGKPVVTFHIVALAGGRTAPADTIAYAGGGVSSSEVLWDSDEGGFTYTRYPVAGEFFNLALYHHTLGRNPASDPPAFGIGYSRIAEYRLIASEDGRHAAVVANVGDAGPSEIYLRTPRGWRRAADTTLGIRGAEFVGGRLLAIATAGGTPRGRLLAIGSAGDTTPVLPQGDQAMHGVAPIAGGFLVQWIWGMDQRLAQYGADGKLVRAVPLPAGIAIGTIASSASSPEALIAYSGWTVPVRWVRYDGRTGALTTLFEVQPAADYSKVAVSRIEATSLDGTRVPVTVLALPGTPRDGSAPAVLTSYGGFGLPVTPTFLGPWLAWLEHGGVLAYANIRGGDEFGETWHGQGMLRQKQNVFDDFFAAAEALVRERWTSTQRLGIMGRSNGGLLMGSVLTQHPEAFRAVAAFVGIYDMTRHKGIANGQYNIPEYGTADDSADFAAQYAYSALFRVKAGTAYPAVLLETGVNDPLVAPWQSREFAAALQHASGSGRPVLLRTRLDEGHAAASFAQAMGNTTMMMTFLAHELGLRQ